MSKVDTVLLTQAEYAQWRSARGLPGATRAAVGKAVATGRITVQGERKLIDPVQADVQWARNTRFKSDLDDSRPAKKPEPAPPVPPKPTRGVFSERVEVELEAIEDGDLMHHRTREMAAKATLLEMEVAEKARSLVRADEMRRTTMSAWRFLRDMLQTFGRQTAPKVAHLTDVHDVQAVIEGEMRALLQTFGERTLPDLLKAQGGTTSEAQGIGGSGV